MKKSNLSEKVNNLIEAIRAADLIELSPTSPQENMQLWNEIESAEEYDNYLCLTEECSGDDEGMNIETIVLYETFDSATVKGNQIITQDEDGKPVIIAIFAKVGIDIDIS